MASFSGKFDSARQDWPTPTETFEPLHREFGFTLDVAASAENAKCPRYFSKEDDAMLLEWGPHVCWLNPPYGDKGGYSLQQWVRKARKEADRGSTVVMLIPARTNTNWFHDICLARSKVRFVRGRPKFGEACHGLPQPLCIVVMTPDQATDSTSEKEAFETCGSAEREAA